MLNKSYESKALFLDRDGVINVDTGYVCDISAFEFKDGIFALAQKFQSAGYLIIVITNQSGIGRGYYSEKDFDALNMWMLGEFEKKGVLISKTYYCPYHPTEAKGEYLRNSQDRKPNPGMILKAKREFNLSLEHSVLIGDSISDIEAGRSAGVGTLVYLSEKTENGAPSGDVITTKSLCVINPRMFAEK